MTEKELISQLHNLKNIKPDHQWKNDNRAILVSQVGSGEELVAGSWSLVRNIFSWGSFRWVTEPVGVMSIITLLLVGGSIASVRAARNTVPGDSLYIAKIISEKTQQAVTFGDKAKAQLGIEFASNRTKELTQVMTEPQNQSKVEQLQSDFKQEIQSAKSRLDKIAPSVVAKKKDSNNVKGNPGDDKSVFTADSGKTNAGIQVSNNNLPSSNNPVSSSSVKENKETPVINTEATSTKSASSTAPVVQPAQTNDPKAALDEAEKLFDQKDYSGTLSKLEEANNIIDNKQDKTSQTPAATSTK